MQRISKLWQCPLKMNSGTPDGQIFETSFEDSIGHTTICR